MMEITDPRILNYRVMSQEELWNECKHMDGTLTLGLAFGHDNFPREDVVLIAELDPYRDIDSWVTYSGLKFYVDMELYTAQDIMKDVNLPRQLYPAALAYYIINDAFLPSQNDPFLSEYKGRNATS